MLIPSIELNPAYLAPSAWWQHVPIAHWLIETFKPATVVELGTHFGVSFFAFCEAAEAFSPSTFIHAVDTWAGDEHAGHYGEEVWNKVSAERDTRHRTRSQLIRSTFDDAAEYFEDNSIDLLHIDGLHTYDAVKHDYETWLPKMKSESIILFHDTNVRERHFGVCRLWDELKQKHTVFEVPNGHGLGIVVLGENNIRQFEGFHLIAKALQAKGALLEKFSQLTPESCSGSSPLQQARNAVEQMTQQAEQARITLEFERSKIEQIRADVEQMKAEALQARADADQAKAEALQAKADADQSKADANQARDDAIHCRNETEKLRNEAEAAQHAANHSNAYTQQLKDELDQERLRNQTLINESSEMICGLREELISQTDELSRTTSQLKNVLSSTSWRITTIPRNIMDNFQKTRSQIKSFLRPTGAP